MPDFMKGDQAMGWVRTFVTFVTIIFAAGAIFATHEGRIVALEKQSQDFSPRIEMQMMQRTLQRIEQQTSATQSEVKELATDVAVLKSEMGHRSGRSYPWSELGE